MRRHMQHGEGGDRAGPILGSPCGDNRQTRLGGRGPPGCSGERDRWLPLGGDDLINAYLNLPGQSQQRPHVYASVRLAPSLFWFMQITSADHIQPKLNDADTNTTSHATTKRSPSPKHQCQAVRHCHHQLCRDERRRD